MCNLPTTLLIAISSFAIIPCIVIFSIITDINTNECMNKLKQIDCK